MRAHPRASRPRPLLRRVTAAAAVGGLALGGVAGCGGEPPPTLPPAGGETVEEVTASASAEPSRPASARPTERQGDGPRFPADLKVLYQARPASGDAASAIRDFGRFWRAWWYAAATGGRDTRYRSYVAPGSFLGGTGVFAEVVASWKDSGTRPTGTIRAHAVEAAGGDGGRVYLSGCGDESKAGAKNVNTGQVDWSFGRSESSRYRFRVVLARSGGTWRIHEYRSFPADDPAGRECRG